MEKRTFEIEPLNLRLIVAVMKFLQVFDGWKND
jgi:hypothetical protein